jgi:DNA-binding XRE family transcriptional regulator
MNELQEKDWVEDTMVGKQFHLFAKERQHAMNDLVRYSQIALSLGLQERAVKLAESYGEYLANLLHAILYDKELGLTQEQLAAAPRVVRRHLILLEGGGEEEPVLKANEERKEIPVAV